MKKKSHHAIPDFSRKASKPGASKAAPQSGKPTPPPPARPSIKPQATSAKAGRRGQ
ncbi:MAG TPA: hypothetical protein VHQ45_04085 [Gemmatimonadaceae bacterium]|nr:hypothetical protein [Gemmatimonadaceae bacterium]